MRRVTGLSPSVTSLAADDRGFGFGFGFAAAFFGFDSSGSPSCSELRSAVEDEQTDASWSPSVLSLTVQAVV